MSKRNSIFFACTLGLLSIPACHSSSTNPSTTLVPQTLNKSRTVQTALPAQVNEEKNFKTKSILGRSLSLQLIERYAMYSGEIIFPDNNLKYSTDSPKILEKVLSYSAPYYSPCRYMLYAYGYKPYLDGETTVYNLTTYDPNSNDPFVNNYSNFPNTLIEYTCQADYGYGYFTYPLDSSNPSTTKAQSDISAAIFLTNISTNQIQKNGTFEFPDSLVVKAWQNKTVTYYPYPGNHSIEHATDGLQSVLAGQQEFPSEHYIMVGRVDALNDVFSYPLDAIPNFGNIGSGEGGFRTVDTGGVLEGAAVVKFGDQAVSPGIRALDGVIDMSGLTYRYPEDPPTAVLSNFKFALNPYSVSTPSPTPTPFPSATPTSSSFPTGSTCSDGSPILTHYKTIASDLLNSYTQSQKSEGFKVQQSLKTDQKVIELLEKIYSSTSSKEVANLVKKNKGIASKIPGLATFFFIIEAAEICLDIADQLVLLDAVSALKKLESEECLLSDKLREIHLENLKAILKAIEEASILYAQEPEIIRNNLNLLRNNLKNLDLSDICQNGCKDESDDGYLNKDDFDRLPENGVVDSKKIRYAQDSIRETFKDSSEGTVWSMIKKLADKKMDPLSIEPIKIVVKHGKVFTLNHRRLFVYKETNLPIPYEKLDEFPEGGDNYFTTDNCGKFIQVRK